MYTNVCRFDGQAYGEKKTQPRAKLSWKKGRVKSHVGRAKSPFGRAKPPVQESAFVKLFIRTAKSWNMPVVRQSRLLSQKNAHLHEQAQQMS